MQKQCKQINFLYFRVVYIPNTAFQLRSQIMFFLKKMNLMGESAGFHILTQVWTGKPDKTAI